MLLCVGLTTVYVTIFPKSQPGCSAWHMAQLEKYTRFVQEPQAVAATFRLRLRPQAILSTQPEGCGYNASRF